MAKPPAKIRESKITIPERCNPYARLVFALMKQQAVTYQELEFRSGVLTCSIKQWRKDNSPGLASIEAALGALGWWFVPTPQEDKIPDHIRAKIKAIAEEWTDFDEVLGRVVIGMCRPETLKPGRPGKFNGRSNHDVIEGDFRVVKATAKRPSKIIHPEQVSLFSETLQ